jgi:hypothetical protein
LSEIVKTLRRSGLTVLKTALAVAQKFNIKRPFPFHDSGTPNLPSPTGPLAIPKTFTNQPAPQTTILLLLPNRFANYVCASLAKKSQNKNGRLSSTTLASQNGRSQLPKPNRYGAAMPGPLVPIGPQSAKASAVLDGGLSPKALTAVTT